MLVLIGILIGLAVGGLVGVVLGSSVAIGKRRAAADREIERLTTEAARAAEGVRREAQVEAREEALKLRKLRRRAGAGRPAPRRSRRRSG